MKKSVLKEINKKIAPGNYLFSPEWIVLGVNNVCNLHCKMCDVGTKTTETNFAQNLIGTHPLNMPLELIFKVIDEISTHYPKAKLAYAFTEPLVYPYLIDSLKYAEEQNIYTTVTTNALTLNNKAIELTKVNLNEIYISLDGPESIHNEIRGHKKSFQKALEGIKILSDSKNSPKISIICAITEWNIGYLNDFLESLTNYKIAEVGFMHTQFCTQESSQIHNQSQWGIQYPSTISNIDEIDFSNYDLNTLLKEVSFIKNNNYPFKVYFSPDLSSKESLQKFYLTPTSFFGKSCNAIYSNIMIKSDGSAIPAHGRCYNLKIGNVYNSSLKEIWNSSILKNLREDLNSAGGLFPACSRCCSAY